MKPEYLPKTVAQVIGYAVEESGELQHAIGKMLRWGPFGANPELRIGDREPNVVWVRREIRDVKRALAWLDAALEQVVDADDELLRGDFDVTALGGRPE